MERLIVDCSTGERRRVKLTPQEEADLMARKAEGEAKDLAFQTEMEEEVEIQAELRKMAKERLAQKRTGPAGP